jgi:hypothetical protein
VPWAITVPAAVGEKEAEQLEVVALTPASVQGLPANDPLAVPLLLKATLPAGALAVPAEEVSLTNAVQLIDWATTTVEGEQVTAVVVVLRLTVTAVLDPELVVWTPSVGLYDPLAMTVPELVGVKVTLQLETVELMEARVHGLPVKLPPAVPVLVKATVPPGDEAVPEAVSLTKPVQEIAWLTTTAEGEQVTVVDVDLVAPTVTVLLVPELAR